MLKRTFLTRVERRNFKSSLASSEGRKSTVRNRVERRIARGPPAADAAGFSRATVGAGGAHGFDRGRPRLESPLGRPKSTPGAPSDGFPPPALEANGGRWAGGVISPLGRLLSTPGAPWDGFPPPALEAGGGCWAGGAISPLGRLPSTPGAPRDGFPPPGT